MHLKKAIAINAIIAAKKGGIIMFKDKSFWIIAAILVIVSFFSGMYFYSDSSGLFDFSYGALKQGFMDSGKALGAVIIGRLIWTDNVKNAVYKQIGNKKK